MSAKKAAAAPAAVAPKAAPSGPLVDVAVDGFKLHSDARLLQATQLRNQKLERELWSSLGTSLRLRIAQSSSDGSLHARKEIASLRKRLTGRTTDQRDLLSTVDFEREVVRGSSERGAEMQPATGKGLPE